MKLIPILVKDADHDNKYNCTVNFNPNHIMTVRELANWEVEIQLVTGISYICPAVSRAMERLRAAGVV